MMQLSTSYAAGIMANHERFFHNLGERIAQLRKERGWSQTALGQRAGLSQQIIASYECGQRQHLPLCRLMDIADALGVDCTELITKNCSRGKRGPASRVEKLATQIARLPKGRQQFVIEMIEDAIARA